MPPHPYGWLSLLPSLVAIVLAIVTRRVVLSLLLGIVAGALVTTGGNVLQALVDTLEVHLWPTITDPGKLRVFCFTVLMGAMIGIIHRTGGMHSLVEAVTPLARTRRSGQLTTWLMGLVIFFDDYANTLLLGSTFQPLCDRLKISREKLAYVVDSTAAPVAGLALVSTWVAVEIDYIREGLETLSDAEGLQAFDLFFASIPYRFYMWMALLFVPLTAILGRDFGPMLHAERRRRATSDTTSDSSAEFREANQYATQTADGHWMHAVVPILVTLAMVLFMLVHTGRAALLEEDPQILEQTVALRQIFGAADSSVALQYGALVGISVAVGMALAARLVNGDELLAAAERGARVVLPAIAILSTAAALSRMTGNRDVEGQPSAAPYEFRDHRLYTGDYLKQLIAPDGAHPANDGATVTTRDTSARTLPTVVFVLSSIVAFCTGTSWGTMGILMPMAVTLAHALLTRDGLPIDPGDPILLGTVGAVLAGSVFGDHCSPISDTTVLSSQASGCDHIAHVRTQLPYAVLVACVAVVLGTLPIGWGAPAWVLLPLQFVALVIALRLLGGRTST